MHRVEIDLKTGERFEIKQKAYRDVEGNILVLDASEKAPSGYSEFDPTEEMIE